MDVAYDLAQFTDRYVECGSDFAFIGQFTLSGHQVIGIGIDENAKPGVAVEITK